MAEGSRVRLVRCPKCENLLPELPHFSLYQCGGCGAVLRAKKNVTASDGLLEKSEKERNGESFEKLESSSEKEGVGSSLDNASETERESEGIVAARTNRRKERVIKERSVNFVDNSLSRTKTNDGSIGDNDQNMKKQNMGTSGNDKYRRLLKHRIDSWVHQGDNGVNKELAKSANSGREKGIAEMPARLKSFAGSLRSRIISDQWSLDNYDSEGYYDRSKYSTSAYPDEGPSNYRLRYSSNRNSMPVKNYSKLDEVNRIDYLEQDSAELLRKLDELKEQFSKSFDVAGNHRERIPVDNKIAPPDHYCGHATYNASMQPLAPDKQTKPPHFKQYGHGQVPYMTSHDIDMPNLYFSPKHTQKQNPTYENQFQPQLSRVHCHQPPHQCRQQPPHGHVSGQYKNFNQEFGASYSQENFYHQPTCSCFHCNSKNWHIPSQVPPGVFGNHKVQKNTMDFNFSMASGMWSYSPQANPFVKHSLDVRRHARWPSNIDSDFDGFYQSQPQRVVAAAPGNRRVCHPIAGGAPFIACYNCFELLRLPKKLTTMGKNQQRMQCGACNTVFLVEIDSKRLIVSALAEKKQLLSESDDESCEVSKEVILSCDGFLNAGCTNCSDDFDHHPGYNFHSADFKESALAEDQRLNVSEYGKLQGLTSLSYSSSEEEGSLHGMVDQSAKDGGIFPTFQGPHLQEHLDYVSSDDADNRYEKVNYMKDVTVPNEVEASFDDCINTSLSQDSTDVSKGEDLSRTTKESQSFLFSLIKKSFRDFSKSNQCIENGRPNVSVNGHPILDRIVKRAEKQAGRIQPGDYWYDFQAGFWGVMGQPCLGIIPPFIKEFNYPMPENCSAGNTRVFVNGRELHQKDLDLLSSRGLPTTREKFYAVEISGRVLDEDSGEELERLGRLAPTVQKFKRGFGMKAPRKLV